MTGPNSHAMEGIEASPPSPRRRTSSKGETKARVRAFRPDQLPDRSSGLRELPVLGRGPSTPAAADSTMVEDPDRKESFHDVADLVPTDLVTTDLVTTDTDPSEVQLRATPLDEDVPVGPETAAPLVENPPPDLAAPTDRQLQGLLEEPADLTAPAQKTIWVPAAVQDALRAQKDATGMTFTESLLDAFDSRYEHLDELFPPIPKRNSPLPQRRPGRRSRIVGGQALIHMRMSDEEWLVLKQICDRYLVSSLSEFLTTIYETTHGIEPTYRRPRRG